MPAEPRRATSRPHLTSTPYPTTTRRPRLPLPLPLPFTLPHPQPLPPSLPPSTPTYLFTLPPSRSPDVLNKPDNLRVSVYPSHPVSPSLPRLTPPTFTLAIKPASHPTHRRANHVQRHLTRVYMRLETVDDHVLVRGKAGEAQAVKPEGVAYNRKRHVYRVGWKEISVERPMGEGEGEEEDWVELRMVDGEGGFMEVVTTMGGSTEGRRSQKYVTLKAGATYALLLSPSLTSRGMQVSQVCMDSREERKVLPYRTAATTQGTTSTHSNEWRRRDNDDGDHSQAMHTHGNAAISTTAASILHSPRPSRGLCSLPVPPPPASPAISELSSSSPLPSLDHRDAFTPLPHFTLTFDLDDVESLMSTPTPEPAPARSLYPTVHDQAYLAPCWSASGKGAEGDWLSAGLRTCSFGCPLPTLTALAPPPPFFCHTLSAVSSPHMQAMGSEGEWIRQLSFGYMGKPQQ